ncbi:MAG: hypothetical protein WAW75_00120 [Gallionella sp.]
MATPAVYETPLRNAQLDAKTTYIGNAGLLKIYDAAYANVLSTHTFGSPFAPAASAGVLTGTLPANVNASLTGTAALYRIYKADGTTLVEHGGVGATGSGEPCIVNSTSFISGVAVQVLALTTTAGNA